MKKTALNLFLATAFFCLPFARLNSQSAIEKQAANIVSQMTLEEKIGQMTQIVVDILLTGSDTDPNNPLRVDEAKVRDLILNYHAGSLLNAPNTCARTPQWWNATIEACQKIAVEETRMKIPIIYGLDQIHGATYTAGSTLFPQEINLAAGWEPLHASRMGQVTAYETRACNVPWTFSPILDLGIDPRFPRQWEGFGEDPYLASVLGVALVKGLEGDNLASPSAVATSLKHFLGYGAPVSGKDRTPAYIPTSVLLEYHLPPFKAAIDAGAASIMINSGIINNVPVHASYEYLTQLLRHQLGFTGVVVSDWADVEKIHTRDRVAGSIKEAIMIAINAGIDMSMVPYDFKGFTSMLKELVDEGKVKPERIDEAATRIIAMKLKLGLFEKPNTYIADYPDFHSKKFQDWSYEAAIESITLLKNEGQILPLAKGTKILLAGPNVQSFRALNGGWTFSWQGEKVDRFAKGYHTILDAMNDRFGKNNVTYISAVSYEPGWNWRAEKEDRFEEAIQAAKKVDVVVLCLGENSYCEKPGDINDLYLTDLQTQLALEMLKTGKKVIVVLNEGRPRIISKFARQTSAIVQAYLPGMYGADAIADVLAGKVNPSGKLPYTYPAFPNSLVPYYHKSSEESETTDNVYDYSGDFVVEFPFGHGISYTTFEYSNASISPAELPCNAADSITITVDVKNSGKMQGKEVVQLYSRDLYASLMPDVKRLRAFKKIDLKAGETRKVLFKLPVSALSFINFDGKPTVEPGEFEFQVGASSASIKAKLKFTAK